MKRKLMIQAMQEGIKVRDRHLGDAPQKDLDWAKQHKDNILEWAITYAEKERAWKDEIFIFHAKTKELAEEGFIHNFPNRFIKGIEYYGIYFNL